MERLRSCFVYASDGHVADGDVQISSRDPRVQENIAASVTPLPGAISHREELALDTLPRLPDPSVAADGYRWADVVERRADEVPQSVRDHVAEALAARVRSGELVEVYHRITTAEARTGTRDHGPRPGRGALACSGAAGRGRSEPAAAKAARNRATMSHRELRRPTD